MVTRYIIKVTYLEGDHKGKVYFLCKGGHVTELENIQWEDTTYKTEGICRRVCERMFDYNELSKRIERQNEAYKISNGGSLKKFYIYESQSYEPYPVEAVSL